MLDIFTWFSWLIWYLWSPQTLWIVIGALFLVFVWSQSGGGADEQAED